jgi:glutathione reductase (NADPH)
MARYDFDLITIGAGSGGVRASRMSAQMGAKVAIIEESRVGGTCVIRGCVPKKLLVYGAHFAEELEDAKGFGWTVPPPIFSWGQLIANKNREIDRLNGVYINLLKTAGVRLIEGHAVLVDAHKVDVGGKTYTAEHILIATGSRPHLPTIPGVDYTITSNEALDLLEQPHRIVIIGGGYIAVEFAGIFCALGSEVTLVVRGERLLRGFDAECVEAMAVEMGKRGMGLRLGRIPVKIEKAEDGAYTTFLDDGSELHSDLVLCATGRHPNTKGLNLPGLGIQTTATGSIAVDEYSTTSVPGIYAIGDVTDRMNLTPVAIAEGAAFARTVFGKEPIAVDYTNVPTAVFGQPPLAGVGLTEADARASHGAVDIYISRFRPMKHTLSGRDERTLMKLIADRRTQRILGCHMMGPDAPEIIQGLAIALKCGATKAEFDATIGIHPTAAEEFVTMRIPEPERK